MFSFEQGVLPVGCTCKPLDVGEEDGDLLVAVDVDLVELVGLEVALHALLLLRDVADHLLRHELGQHCIRTKSWRITNIWIPIEKMRTNFHRVVRIAGLIMIFFFRWTKPRFAQHNIVIERQLVSIIRINYHNNI